MSQVLDLGSTNELVDTYPLGMPNAQAVIEIPLLLPEWQVDALEAAAKARGMTIGQLLRKLLADVFPVPKAKATA